MERSKETMAVTRYVVGFVLSIALTAVAYVLVAYHMLTGVGLTLAIMGLAAVQLAVQLVCFLHLGRDPKKRWNMAAFLFMGMVLLIIVLGSLWIMANMNYNMGMTPEQMDQFMKEQSNKGF